MREDLQLPIVDVIYAGGTISSVMTEGGYRRGGSAFHLTSLLNERIGEVADALTPYELGNEVVKYDGLSENLIPIDQAKIAGGIHDATQDGHNSVTTHGTDSMEKSIDYFYKCQLDKLAEEKGTRIIITGANEDMYDPNTDVWENLQFALEQAGNTDVVPGIYLAYHGKLIPGYEVAKVKYRPDRRPTFDSINSAEYLEALAYHQATVDDQVRRLASDAGHEPDGLIISYNVNAIITDHEKFLSDVVANPGITSVLLKLYHSGTANANTDPKRAKYSIVELITALRNKVRPDLVFFGATENGEPVDLHSYETSVALREAGVVPLYDMLFGVAREKLRLIDQSLPPSKRIDEMLKNRIGEINPHLIQTADIKAIKQTYAPTPPQGNSRRTAVAA